MNKKAGFWGIIIIFIIIIVSFFILGFIGHLIANNSDSICDFGLGKYFCWTWHEVYTYQVE